MMNCPKCNAPLELRLAEASTNPTPRPNPTPRTTSQIDADSGELTELLASIDEAQCEDGKAADFVVDIRARFAQYGKKTLISEKQIKWLRSIRDNQGVDSNPF